MEREELRRARRNMQIIFQDPFSSLNPRMTIESIIGEALEFHQIAKGDRRREMVEELLVKVGLQPSYISRYPHEFSGGQRQRLGIARALALNPKFIVCDEAVSALDVSVQAQVINLLQDLQEEYNLSYLFIAHDLSVVKHISDRIAVMYLGQIVELAECDELFENPRHPYTQALLSAIPHPNPKGRKQRVILKGDVPSPINPPSGCRFHTRCPACFAPCSKITPKIVEVEPGHQVRCHLYDKDHAPSDLTIFERLPQPVPEGKSKSSPSAAASSPEPAPSTEE
jgi:oligopeptide/dipeptide ABC transporter ATP-binding protein